MTSISKDGYKIVDNIYSKSEIGEILKYLENSNVDRLFGVREFLKSHSSLRSLIFTENLMKEIGKLSRTSKVVKSLYFDKPPQANWIVNWHQDLTINVRKKIPLLGYENWRELKERTVVQPPIKILENIFTIRIHLDDCTEKNGALRVIKSSHREGVIDVRNGIREKIKEEIVCEVGRGGILIMKPLILHSSKRTENNRNRRIIHIEFCDLELPMGLNWNESLLIENTTCA